MRETLFPRWCAALFALLPLGELLYAPIDAQTGYAAALACLLCALPCAVCARLAPSLKNSRAARCLLAAAALWPLCASLARMGLFLRDTVFDDRPLWSLILPLTVCVMLSALSGLTRCAMWALPAAWCAGAVAVLSGVLTVSQLQPGQLAAPGAALLPQMWTFLRALLPAALVLALSLPENGLAGAASRGLWAGGALLALLSLRAVLLLGTHTAALLPYPNFSAAGLAAVGDFARHGEVFFAVPLLLCEVGRCAALASVLLRAFPGAKRLPAAEKPDS